MCLGRVLKLGVTDWLTSQRWLVNYLTSFLYYCFHTYSRYDQRRDLEVHVFGIFDPFQLDSLTFRKLQQRWGEALQDREQEK